MMTWQDARSDALELAEKISQSHPDSKEVILVEFDSATTYKLLRGPDDPPAWKYHLQIVRAAARLLYPRGFKVRRVTVMRDDYFKWLAASGRDHSPEAVTEFAASLP